MCKGLKGVVAILYQTAPLVEQVSIDEAYLDLTDQIAIWDEGVELARRLQARVREKVGLSASLGVASNKLVAKVASDRDKPGGLTVVRPGEEATFLSPLPVRALWGIGPVTAGKLAEMGVTTVGQLAQVPKEELRGLRPYSGQPLVNAMARIVVFVDGSPHHRDYVQEADQRKRMRLKRLGYRIVVARAEEPETRLDDLAARLAR